MNLGMAQRLADWWNRFWFSETDPRIYAALRGLFGMLGIVSLLGLLDPQFWRCDGLTASRGDAVCGFFESRGLGALPGYATLGFALLSFLAMAVGLFSRTATVCAFGSMYLLARWNALPLSAAHQILRTLLFCLIWADTGRVWSADAWLASRRGQPVNASAPSLIWPQQLIRIQIAAIYLVTGLWKLNNVLWRDGSALHYVLENNQFRRFSFPATAWVDALSTMTTYATLAWELGFVLLVFHSRARQWVLAVGIAIHLGMWVTLELGPFTWIMLASYVAFVDPVVTGWVSTTPRPKLARRADFY